MTPLADAAFLTPADSARAVSSVYTASLLAILPIALAAVAVLALRRRTAEGRALVWRSAIMALLLVYVGRQLAFHWLDWVLPSTLAAPLIALGRVQVTSAMAPYVLRDASQQVFDGVIVVRLLLVIYVAGIVGVLTPTLVASIRIRRLIRGARPIEDGAWSTGLAEAQRSLGMARSVRLLESAGVAVPMTAGVLCPVIVLPPSASACNESQRRMVLMHELAHVRAADWAFNLAGRLVCALYWFHPGVWWIARRLRTDCELACDDHVIESGARRSEYAELLVEAADRAARVTPMPVAGALALAERGGLRPRLVAVLNAGHVTRPLPHRWVAVAATATLFIAGPTSAVRLAPTRDVLTRLVRDARWESRAYAVLGLAQRRDSVAVARSVAERDPNPRVRAWARYALGNQAELRTIIHER
ncbi:MAG TPA: M56 family metallopeptidase [Acidimicrobiia bacterium]|nr:M56 family metallopeptidase [Acidimicrobiia bacterium]